MEGIMSDKTKSTNFFKKAFSLQYISLPLSLLSLLLSLLVVFMPLVSYTLAIHHASISLFFIAFILSLSGLIIEIVKLIKNEQSAFSIQIAIVMFSLFIVCIVAPLTINAYSIVG